MKLQSLSISLATGLVLVAACSTSCALSTKVRVTSEPSGARVWVGDQRGGVTPTEVRLRATGPLRHSTFEPEYVTVDADGYARETVIPDYEWSIRNVVL
ncbi:MAG: PEGA domain-containing protein, partial [Myxococcales bacterium]|nr:PEGA domain-containing protein [Myxococcales bacterium]